MFIGGAKEHPVSKGKEEWPAADWLVVAAVWRLITNFLRQSYVPEPSKYWYFQGRYFSRPSALPHLLTSALQNKTWNQQLIGR